MRRIVISILIAIVSVTLPACQGNADKKTVKLGAVLPLTGPAASAGNEMNNAVLLAVDEWNKTDRMGGYRIEADIKDDASDPKQAVAAAHALVSDPKVAAIVAHLNSGCFLPASKIYHDSGVPAMSGATTNPVITLQGFDEIFRICTTDLVQGELTVPFLQELGFKRIAIFHDKTQYGMGLAEVVRDSSPAHGFDVLRFDGIDVGEKDFRALLTVVKDLNPDVVYFGGMYDEAGLMVKQMRDLGMNQQFVSDDGAFGQDFIDAGGDATENALVSMVGVPLTDLEQAQDFMARYKQRYGMPIQNYGPYAYDVANILLTSISRVIERTGSPDKAGIIEEIKKTEYDGVIGHTSFDENGDTKNRIITFYRVQGGKFVPTKTMNLNP